MKSISVVTLIALLSIGFFACDNSGTKNTSTITPSDTSGKRLVMISDSMYTCKMDQDVMSEKPGKCPKCGMTLVKQKMTDDQKRMMKEGTYTKPKE